jgi:hypothetical protein
MLTCARLRTSVLTSGALLAIGIVLGGIGQVPMLCVHSCYLSLFSILAAVALLVLTFLISLLPSEARRLNECQH